jgi:hypothetical protein
MSTERVEQRIELQSAYIDYRAAFRDWTAAVGRRSSLPPQVARIDALDEARNQEDAAESSYREARERLIDYVEVAVPGAAAPGELTGEQKTAVDRRLEIEQLAYSLWEQSGRPEGTADSDWYRAEALLLAERR